MLSLRRSLSVPDACKGFAAIEQERERIADRLPGDPANLWQSGNGAWIAVVTSCWTCSQLLLTRQ
jgi:hypothetical protein